MRNFVSIGMLAAGIAALAGCSSTQTVGHFDAGSYQADVAYLASDDLQGRGLGSEGIEKAAAFIADRFQSLGLQPAGTDGSYFQSFPVKLDPELKDGSTLVFAGEAGNLVQGTDFVPFTFSSSTPFDADVVFAGYGIVHEDKEHDDYVHLDVTDKIVLMLRREPAGWADAEGDPTPHAQFANKIYTAKEHGAAAVLIVNQRPEEGDKDELMSWDEFRGGGLNADFGVPALHITRALADRLLAAGGLDSLTALQDKLDGGGFASAALSDVRLTGQAAIERREVPTVNVVGLLPGAGPLASEILVIGAHYDHLGVTIPRTVFGHSKRERDAEPEIHNGADDNASGTAGVIELARVLRAAGPWKRSILFIAFTGEESGLLGSKHFVDNPPAPLALENMVAMLNLDMIGRLKEGSKSIQVFGTQAAEEFEKLVEHAARGRGLEIQGSASAFGPSDHTSFYTKKIPAMHFFTGLHTDYHLPGDDTDKLNIEGSMHTLELVGDIAAEILQAKQRPTYKRIAPPARTGRAKFRVRMGIMPGYADTEDGMTVDGVLEDGPAEKAGMLDGDKITRIGETKVGNVHDYMAALRNNNPGDEVEVDVLRDGETVTLKVVLTGG